MPQKVVAKVWWPAPHDGLMERFVFEDHVLRFGRHSSADIRIGHAPVPDPTVPRIWGEISWHRGRMFVENLDERWGFDLVPVDGTDANRISVDPGASASPRAQRFQVIAQAPGSQHVLEIMSADPRRFSLARKAIEPTEQDPASFVPFELTPTQKLIGNAIRDHLRAGHSRRPSYQELAAKTGYSLRTIRENIQVMDARFLLHELTGPGQSDALDRVAQVLVRHPGVLQAAQP